MAKTGPSRLRPLMFWLTPITRSPAQKSACKDLGIACWLTLRNAFASLRVRTLSAMAKACKDLKRNGQNQAITLKAAYTPTSKRAGSRLPKKSPQPSLPTLHR
ncbi:Malolactic regulator [Lactobacillus sp. HMSC077C11]|nr:Malolactic regulator [Lactobacillus sp. HMSC077C11]